VCESSHCLDTGEHSLLSHAQADALVLLSGGQDSCTCLALALSEHKRVRTLCINYGQRHDIEIQKAEQLAKVAGVPFQIISLDFLPQLTQNALTNHEDNIETLENGLPSTFVPGRNALFLNVAAIAAYEMGIQHIYIGVCQTDYSGYPDCREAFIQSMTQSMNLAMDSTLNIHTPLMHLSKADTVKLMAKLGRLDWYQYTHSCYEGVTPPCGKCPACKLRQKGFEAAGIPDPALSS